MKVKPRIFPTLVESNIEYFFRILVYITVLHETCAHILLTCIGHGRCIGDVGYILDTDRAYLIW
jgi:hypothetical protein